jgi:hypothetical protein
MASVLFPSEDKNPTVLVPLNPILGSVFQQRARMMLPRKEAHLQAARGIGDSAE